MKTKTAWDTKPAYRAVKRALDVALSGAAFAGLSPLMGACAVAVRVTSPGPVLFRQERVGIHGKTFQMYKFRTMRIDTPQLPSHMIDANAWLTPVGGFLRASSLDELPQLANILRGDMSIVGPRPPLPSQTDLIAAREEGGANDVPPGLTGLAQVSGRDELPIAQKAAFDVEYAQTASLGLDARLVLMTFGKVFRRDGVVEDEVPEPEGASA